MFDDSYKKKKKKKKKKIHYIIAESNMLHIEKHRFKKKYICFLTSRHVSSTHTVNILMNMIEIKRKSTADLIRLTLMGCAEQISM